MKKYWIFLVTIIIFTHTVYANETKWEVVSKDINNGIDYSMKIGDYFFDFKKTYDRESFKEVSTLLYSTDGINFIETEYVTSSLPIFSDGKYFLFDNSLENVPESKRTHGFNNSPSYILGNNLGLIGKLEHNCYAKYVGFYYGEHYIEYTDYNNGLYENGGGKTIIYKSENGYQFEEVEENDDITFLKGIVLSDESILYTYFSNDNKEKNKLQLLDLEVHVLRENENYVGKTYLSKSIPLFIMNYVDEEVVSGWYDNREKVERKNKKIFSMDCIYGVEMPEDIGKYCFELDNKFYFEKDANTYYCISKDALSNNIKIIYEGEILAFDVEPISENNRVLVPMRFLFETMGAEVKWDNSEQKIVVEDTENTIEFSINDINVKVNGTLKKMDVPAKLVDSKTMVPIRFLSEELGYNVEWNNITRTVIITK